MLYLYNNMEYKKRVEKRFFSQIYTNICYKLSEKIGFVLEILVAKKRSRKDVSLMSNIHLFI